MCVGGDGGKNQFFAPPCHHIFKRTHTLTFAHTQSRESLCVCVCVPETKSHDGYVLKMPLCMRESSTFTGTHTRKRTLTRYNTAKKKRITSVGDRRPRTLRHMCVTMLVSRTSPIKFCVVVVVVARFQLITYMSVCNNLCPEVMQCGSHVNTLAKREAATQFAIIRHSASLFAEASNRSYHRHTLTHPRNSTHTHTPSATVYYMTRLCGPIGHRDMFFFSVALLCAC